MMDHARYKRLLLADPRDLSPELRAHQAACDPCRQFTDRLLDFESRLARALHIDSAALATGGAGLRGRLLRSRRGWMALAASFLIAAVAAGSLWLAAPGYSLAADVITHMAEEPQAWVRTTDAVSPPQVDQVLKASHIRLAHAAGVISYANSCGFRGHVVPHLVLQAAAGPVTVMVLIHEAVHRRVYFNEQGYRGVIVPVDGHGGLAILSRGETVDSKEVDQLAARVLASIEWTA